MYAELIDIYFEWFKVRNNGVPPKMDGAGGKAAKAIIVYLKSVVSTKAQADNRTMTESETITGVLESWRFILVKWDTLEPFLQKQTRLIDINSNIQNIINQIKNGYGKKQSGPVTGSDLQRNIDNIRAKAKGFASTQGED